jgi:ABC-2 type transport system permease protein
VRTFSSELLKLRTIPRTMLGLAAALLGIAVLVAVGSITSRSNATGDSVLLDVVSVGHAANIFALIVGVLVVTWEYRHGTITQTFLTVPRRERVVAAKTLAASLTGVLLSLAAIVLALAIALPWIGGEPGGQLDAEVWGRIGRLLATAALYAAIGVGVGAVVRAQALAIVLVFIWFFVLEPIVDGLVPDVGQYLPGRSLQTVAAAYGDQHLSPGASAALALVYTGAAVAVGAVLTVRRDVT